MPNPDSVTVEIINSITAVEVSPVEEINQIGVSTVPEVSQVQIDNTDSVTTISFVENSEPLVVALSQVDFSAPVTSVNGKTGAVVIDYPDISSTPVNHVRYVHTQASIPARQTTGQWAGYYIWTVNHNLNFYPSVTVFDSGDNMIEAYIDYTNINTAIIVMNSAISGTAYLS